MAKKSRPISKEMYEMLTGGLCDISTLNRCPHRRECSAKLAECRYPNPLNDDNANRHVLDEG